MGDRLPIARVYVDVGLPHLDRLFDYEVPEADDQVAVPGTRVRVRFSGRLRDGFVVERVAEAESAKVLPISRAVSAEVVLPPSSVELVRAVADHYAGTFFDVVRLAVPPRHAATETAAQPAVAPTSDVEVAPGPLRHYPAGAGFIEALAGGGSPRAAWTLIPAETDAGDWAAGFVAAAGATVASGRCAVVVVPDGRDLDRVASLLEARLGKARVARQTAEVGPAARYRSFLRGLRGQARVIVGTRSAVFAPVENLGLLCLFDDGDDLLSEPRAPYPHARDVAAIRVRQQRAALLLASYSRTAEVEAWLERDWLRPIAVSPDMARQLAPVVRISGDDEFAMRNDPQARAARLPKEAFSLVRTGLTQGPVLIQVPRAGYRSGLSCTECRTPVRCADCHGPLRSQRSGDGTQISCSWCGRLSTGWTCAECGGTQVRSTQVGAERTAEELGRAFPGVRVLQSGQGRILDVVDAEPALVVATPGAEPRADGGFAAALLLDTTALLNRADLRAAEEALRRWLAVTSRVRPASDGGSVLAVGPQSSRALQALVRLDPGGFAARELADRVEAGFPPAVRFAVLEAQWSLLRQAADQLAEADHVTTLGPVLSDDARSEEDQAPARLLARAPLQFGTHLTSTLHTIAAQRSLRKDSRPLRIQVDPVAIS